jgi:ABC-type nitrate/sulfonate/bicarbonate transport system permease component
MRRSALRAGGDLWPGVLSVALALAGWGLASAYLVDPALLPSPLQVWQAGLKTAASGELVEAVGVSLSRIAIGYLLGAAAGVVTGLILGGIRAADAVLGPVFEFLKGLPPIALVPLTIMWFGIGEFPKHVIIAYIVWVVVTVNTAVGVREIPVLRLRAGQSLGLTAPERFVRIVIPSVASYLLIGLRNAIGFSYVALVSAELVAASSGLGYLIMDSRFSLQTARMIVGLIVLGLLGALSQFLFDTWISRSRFVSRYVRQ